MQRAIACAALAEGSSLLRNPSESADCLAALALVEALGARVRRLPEGIAIEGGILGLAPRDRLQPPDVPARRLSCGESALCMRLFAPIVALLPGLTILEAEGSLRKRPFAMVDSVLEPLGATCSSKAGHPPLEVRGPLRGGSTMTDARESSQFVSGLLLALPLAPLDSRLEARALVSPGYVELTLDTMRGFGLELGAGDAASPAGLGAPSGLGAAGGRVAVGGRGGEARFDIRGARRYTPSVFEVEGDWSAAAFLLVAAAIAAVDEPLVLAGLSFGSSQPDRAIMGLLEGAGARLERRGELLAASRGRPEPFSFDARDCPDLVPPLVALASATPGLSRIGGVSRLRGKESDRAAALIGEFARFGIEIGIEGEELVVRGGRARGALVDARGDHRIAMAAAIAALAASGPVTIEGSDCVAKSWPGFFEDLGSLRRGLA